MLKFELNLILQFLSYEVIMPRNIFLDHSPFFLSSHGILHWSSCAYTCQHNGMAKRKNRHLVETAHTFLLHHKVLQRFWGDATLDVCYLIDRMSSFVLHDKIPHSIIFPKRPLFCLLPRVFFFFFFDIRISLVSLVVFVLSIFLLLDKTSFQPKP